MLTAMQAFSTSRPSSLARLSIIGRLGQVPTVAKDKQGRDVIIYSVGTSDKITSSASVCRVYLLHLRN